MPTMLTWNMQGGQGTGESKWGNLAGLIRNPGHYGLNSAPDVIFVQECSDVPGIDYPLGWGVPPPNVDAGSINVGTYGRPICYYVARYPWGNANNRVSFAVLARTPAIAVPVARRQESHDLTANTVVHNPVAGAAGTRPIIGVENALATFYSMHAPSGVAAGFSRTYVSGMINAALPAGSYVIGGDLNCEPNNLYDLAHPIPNGQLFSSGQPTCGNNDYDYFTTDNHVVNQTVLNNVRRTGLATSDHISVAADY